MDNNMADGHILRGGCKRINNNVRFSNFNDVFSQIDCTNLIHDGKRFKWISNWETLKNFIEYSLQLSTNLLNILLVDLLEYVFC